MIIDTIQEWFKEVLIDGINVKDLGIHDLRQLIGNVNQEAILFNDSFIGNITFGVDHATQEQVEQAASSLHQAASTVLDALFGSGSGGASSAENDAA